MKLAIMQPYLFPYLGYFQLIRAVDAFVVYDDVNYIQRGWINRNNILTNGKSQLITLPLQGASQNKLINQIEVGGQHKILQSLRQSYGKAPYFDAVYPVLEDILTQAEKNLARFLDYQLRQICEYIGLTQKWHMSSTLEIENTLHGQEKILSICKELDATLYINMPGGKDLYDQESFAARGIKLSFIQPKTVSYHQFEKGFVPHLSIIDVMMFNDREQCAKLLGEYELV
jgi:hypothetical protein